MATQRSGHSFEVTHQEFQDAYGPNGEHHVKARVHFKTPSGTASHVEIPDTHYTAENVHALIAPKVAEIEKVAALDGTPPAPPAPVE